MICKALTEGIEAFMQRKVRGEGKAKRIRTKIKQYTPKLCVKRSMVAKGNCSDSLQQQQSAADDLLHLQLTGS